jgi:hypothetical protein
MRFEVEIVNWEKHNSMEGVREPDKLKWFKLRNDIFADPIIAKLSAAQFKVWIYLLCERSRVGQTSYIVDTDLIQRSLRVRTQFILSSLRLLTDLGRISTKEALCHKAFTGIMRGEERRGEERRGESSDGLSETPARAQKKPKDKSQSSLVWDAYADAYQARYQERPASNAKGYGICKHFIARLPIEEAPEVARFYVSHNDAFYVKQLHPLSLMLRDAEKLRTEWKVGRQMTSDTARKVESAQNNANAILDFLNNREAQQ